MSSVDLYVNRNELQKSQNQKKLTTGCMVCGVLLWVTTLTRCAVTDRAIVGVTKNLKDQQNLIFLFDAGQSVEIGFDAESFRRQRTPIRQVKIALIKASKNA